MSETRIRACICSFDLSGTTANRQNSVAVISMAVTVAPSGVTIFSDAFVTTDLMTQLGWPDDDKIRRLRSEDETVLCTEGTGDPTQLYFLQDLLHRGPLNASPEQ
ncbi:hypothetical protein N7539_002558 [Penicillium diatomitis]|uniref:Uncharacterized protein n=1 Tax=Penicillium diatomitis TaxID=2819901 RepID=A0A9X0BYT4_9EURO|nr:uncharacterized protein N7539_002558 [Penicillium diatomitis]KAJ5490991.1 hypothetical protein N7539_002558 [Penicillium diatomitis]